MKHEDQQFAELSELLEALCEDRITDEQFRQLEQLVLQDQAARRFYLSYIDLHGSLHWDIATAAGDEVLIRDTVNAEVHRVFHNERRKRFRVSVGLAVSVCLLLVAGLLFVSEVFQTSDDRPSFAEADDSDSTPNVTVSIKNSDSDTSLPNDGGPVVDSNDAKNAAVSNSDKKIKLATVGSTPDSKSPAAAITKQTDGNTAVSAVPNDAEFTVPGSHQPLIAFVNMQIRNGWELNGVRPSQLANDGEWIRRVYLDIVGHIPPVEDVERFLDDTSEDKRSRLIDKLLDDQDYVRNWTTIWSNLLIGRSEDRGVDRPALQKFLRESFARNRPWNEIVSELVAAEGRSDENGATNFLLAHLNDQATPATAITARIFMGVQVQCTQCHSHPHNNFKQNQFWELNSFFKQTVRVDRRRPNEQGGMQFSHAELTSKPVGGATFYENRLGVMQAAYPRFNEVAVDPEENVNRRAVLARLMTTGEKPLIAEAIVNRIWKHFCGYGFTRVVDDLGPHNPATHPALFDRLAREFVKSGYDLKQLCRWICNTEVYQLSSRFNATNADDDPASGTDPLFSRMYVKPMTAEQLYDSMIIATRAHFTAGSDWMAAEKMRREWLQQFVIAFETDENDESTNFDGTITQALMMMNGELVEKALSDSHGTYLDEIVRQNGSDVEKIRKLCLSAIARYPSSRELAAVRKLLRERSAGRPRGNSVETARTEGLQDVFWAYLNSNEFILIY